MVQLKQTIDITLLFLFAGGLFELWSQNLFDYLFQELLGFSRGVQDSLDKNVVVLGLGCRFYKNIEDFFNLRQRTVLPNLHYIDILALDLTLELWIPIVFDALHQDFEVAELMSEGSGLLLEARRDLESRDEQEEVEEYDTWV